MKKNKVIGDNLDLSEFPVKFILPDGTIFHGSIKEFYAAIDKTLVDIFRTDNKGKICTKD